VRENEKIEQKLIAEIDVLIYSTSLF